MKDLDLPELPSDEELGIAGLDEEILRRGTDPPAPPRPPAPPTRRRPPPAPAPRSRGAITLVVLLLGAWAASGERTLPSPEPANVPDSVFSSGRAMATLVDLARAPRPVGAPEHARVRQMIVERLEDLGLEPELHETVSLRRTGQTVRAVSLRNVVARIPGTASTGAIVLTSHYDGVPLSRAAGDAGTGVVAILETVRALQAGAPLANDVIVLITDGEEIGLLGARAFIEEHPWMDDVRVVLSAEMRGGGGPVYMFETGAENGWIVRAMRAGDPSPAATSSAVEIYRRLPNDTDFTPFRQAGVQGLNSAAIGRAHVYHQPTDVPANVQEASIQHHGARLLGVVRELGGRDLANVDAPDVVFHTLPVIGVVIYPLAWALPVSGGIALLWVAASLLGAARGARWTDMVVGLGLAIAAGLAAFGMGWALFRWLPRFHPELGRMTPAFYGEGWYVLGLAAAVVAVTVGLLALVRRRFSLPGIAAGALFVPVVGAVVLASIAPLAAPELQGPALAGVLALGAASLAGEGGGTRRGVAAWIASLVFALVALVFLVPFIEGMWMGLSFRAAGAIGVLVAILLACILPALDGLASPNRWWAPAAALGTAVLLTGVGILGAGASAERPQHSTLLFVLDRQEGVARWATRDDPGLEWAEERVGPFSAEGQDLRRFLLPGGYRLASAPGVEIPPPVASVIGPAGPEGSGIFRVEIVSPAGAEIVSVVVPEGGGLVLRGVNGRPFPQAAPGSPGGGRPVTRFTHQGIPLQPLTLEVRAPADAAEIALEVVEHHLRPAELVGPDPFRRPPHLMPNPVAQSDRAVLRTVLRVPLVAVGESDPVEAVDPLDRAPGAAPLEPGPGDGGSR